MSTNTLDRVATDQEVGQLEGQLTHANADIGQLTARLAALRRNRWSMLLLVVLGLAETRVFGQFGWIGAVVAFASLVALVVSFIRHARTKQALAKQQAWVTQANARLSVLKA
jgi:O-antigen/teichoic acid export membrane protein